MIQSKDAQSRPSGGPGGADLIGRRKMLQLVGLAGIGGAFIKGAGGTIAYGADGAPPPVSARPGKPSKPTANMALAI